MNLYQATFNTLVSFRIKTRHQLFLWIEDYDRELFYNLVKKKCIYNIRQYNKKYIKKQITKIYSKYLQGYSNYSEKNGNDLEMAIYIQEHQLDMAVFHFLVDENITDIDDFNFYRFRDMGEESSTPYRFFTEIFERSDSMDMFKCWNEDWMNVGTEYWTELEMDNWKDIIVQSYSKRVKGFTNIDTKLHNDLINWQNSLL